MTGLRGKRILIACSDPGGAQAVLALVPSIIARGAVVTVLARGPAEQFARRAGIPVHMVGSDGPRAVARVIAAAVPHIVLVGTSHIDELPRDVLRAAAASGIPSFAVVDWWTNIRERFTSADGTIVLPGVILVIDAHGVRAVRRAFGYRPRVVAIGHPHLSHIRRESATARRAARASLLRRFRLPADRPIVCFLAEPTDPPTGFDQFVIFRAIAQAFAAVVTERGAPCTLLVKFHPKGGQRRVVASYQAIAGELPRERFVVRFVGSAAPVQPILDGVDFLWGMNTTPLLEAMLRGTLVSSFLHGVSLHDMPFLAGEGYCASAAHMRTFPRLIRALLTDSAFVARARKRQHRYRLPSGDPIRATLAILASALS